MFTGTTIVKKGMAKQQFPHYAVRKNMLRAPKNWSWMTHTSVLFRYTPQKSMIWKCFDT